MKKSILITGAYGGMGLATAKAFASRGFRVFALDRKVGDAEEGIVPIEADLTSRESVERALALVRGETDELYGMIHFAGVYMLDSLIEIGQEAFEKIFKINLFGVYLVNKLFFPLLREGSRIVITTSELAPLDPLPFTGLYAVTKGALDKYAYALRMELQLKSIAVSVLRAGAVTTGMLGVSTDALDRFCENTELYACNAKRFKKIVDSVEARSVAPAKVAGKVLKIVNKKRPRFAYAINRNPLLLLLNILPKSAQLRVIKWVLKSKA